MLLSLSFFYTSCPPPVFPETISQVNRSGSALRGIQLDTTSGRQSWDSDPGLSDNRAFMLSHYAMLLPPPSMPGSLSLKVQVILNHYSSATLI